MRPNRWTLYERCVQNPRALVPLLLGIHGGRPRVLREDFAGSAAVSREWVRRVPGGRAFAVDLDAAALPSASRWRGVRAIVGDATRTPTPRGSKADVTFVGNFSIGEIHDRPALVRFLRAVRRRTALRGVLVMDTYGGSSAFLRGSVQRVHPYSPRSPDVRIRYTWEQRESDPLTGRVVNAIHFRVERDGEIVHEITDAFVYRWRLWSVPELRDACIEAGFARTEVYGQLPDAADSSGKYFARPIESPGELDESFIVCVAARAEVRAGTVKNGRGPMLSHGPASGSAWTHKPSSVSPPVPARVH